MTIAAAASTTLNIARFICSSFSGPCYTESGTADAVPPCRSLRVLLFGTLASEQIRWTDFNRLLEDLERTLARRSEKVES
jgi:hypothetical protein